jgi:hypothetical protein
MSVGGGPGGVANGRGEAIVRDGDGTGGVLAAVLVEHVDEVLAILIGESEGGDGKGIVVFGKDQPPSPGKRWRAASQPPGKCRPGSASF